MISQRSIRGHEIVDMDMDMAPLDVTTCRNRLYPCYYGVEDKTRAMTHAHQSFQPLASPVYRTVIASENIEESTTVFGRCYVQNPGCGGISIGKTPPCG